LGRTALYRDPHLFRTARAEIQLETDALVLAMPDGRTRRHVLDGVAATTSDGVVAARGHARVQRRFVRMLILEPVDRPPASGGAFAEMGGGRTFVITPPELGAVAPNVVRVPEAPAEAAVVDLRAWESLAEWLLGGGRLAAWSIADLARLACIAAPHFAMLIGEIAAQRALELAWTVEGPLRGGSDVDSALQPLFDAARSSPRASEALISALAHAAGAKRRRRRAP
jgi:hypothetical protein